MALQILPRSFTVAKQGVASMYSLVEFIPLAELYVVFHHSIHSCAPSPLHWNIKVLSLHCMNM